jgi:hypothetical protein
MLNFFLIDIRRSVLYCSLHAADQTQMQVPGRETWISHSVSQLQSWTARATDSNDSFKKRIQKLILYEHFYTFTRHYSSANIMYYNTEEKGEHSTGYGRFKNHFLYTNSMDSLLSLRLKIFTSFYLLKWTKWTNPIKQLFKH